MLSTVPDTLETLLVLGVAAELAEWGLATFQPSGEYPADAERPIYLGPGDPVNAPDERLLLTVRPSLAVRGNIVQTPIGFNYRAAEDSDPLGPVNFLGLLWRRFKRLPPHNFGGVRVGAVLFSSAGSLGPDTRRRPHGSATYMFRHLSVGANG